MIASKRTVFKNGISKPENEGIEIGCICECSSCKTRYEQSRYRETRHVSFKNHASIVVWKKDKIGEAINFAKNWKCKDGGKELATEYLTFD